MPKNFLVAYLVLASAVIVPLIAALIIWRISISAEKERRKMRSHLNEQDLRFGPRPW